MITSITLMAIGCLSLVACVAMLTDTKRSININHKYINITYEPDKETETTAQVVGFADTEDNTDALPDKTKSEEKEAILADVASAVNSLLNGDIEI